jgi:DNA helicase HerA-like ATPase
MVVDPNQDDPYPGVILDSAHEILAFAEEFPAFRIVTSAIDELDDIAAVVFALGRTLLVLDEAQSYLSPLINLKSEFPAVRDIVFRGRHNLTSLMTVAQRATSIHVDARSQWTRIVAFHQSEPDDVRWLELQAGTKLDFAALRESEYFDISRHDGVQKKALDTAQ